MAETKAYYSLIKRTKIPIIQSYCEMENIKITNILHNNHDELKQFEKFYGKELTRMDVIVISPLTQPEIDKIIDGYNDNTKLIAWRKEMYEKRVKCYEESFGESL